MAYLTAQSDAIAEIAVPPDPNLAVPGGEMVGNGTPWVAIISLGGLVVTNFFLWFRQRSSSKSDLTKDLVDGLQTSQQHLMTGHMNAIDRLTRQVAQMTRAVTQLTQATRNEVRQSLAFYQRQQRASNAELAEIKSAIAKIESAIAQKD